MRFNCQFAVSKLIPAFRGIIAKQLINKHGLTQEQAASKLGLSQVAVSNYLNSKRAIECDVILGDDFVLVHSLACETAEKLANEKITTDEMINGFCNLCMKLKEDSFKNYNI